MDVGANNKDLKGWLKRKGGRMNTWSRRWFVLKDQFLFIFLKDDDKKSQECITLDGQIITEPPVDPNDPRHGFFDIVTESDKGPGDVLSLYAETEEEKKIWVRALKRALYADKGGALFCQSLEEILQWERKAGRHIPYIVDECVEYLYKYGLDVEGIFRLPGRQSAIKDIISRFERGQKVRFEEEGTDIHVVASVFKTFLRDLPDSIIPCKLFQKFMNIALRFMESTDERMRESCVQELAESMNLVPKDNYVILKYICRFLREVGLHEPTNKMSMMSLGTVFGYNIIRHIDKENSQLFLCTADLGQNLVYMLLNSYTQVFMLEYSDRGSRGNNVPTADLLRMSRIINTPITVPLSFPSGIAELEGIDLTITSSMQESTDSTESLKMNEHHFSSIDSNKNGFESEDSTNRDDSELVRSFDFATERKKCLHLSLKEHPGVTRSYSTPTSPNTNSSMPPVPPRRSKSKINRSRLVSERRRPDGSSFDSQDKSPQSLVTPDGINAEDVLTALSKFNINNANSQESPISSPASTTSSRSLEVHFPHSDQAFESSIITDAEGKIGPSLIDLKKQVTVLKEELSQQRERYRTQITALQAQLTDMKEKYERRIETMEIEYKSQIRDLDNKLTSEKESRAVAISNTAKLQDEIHKYQMQYGDLI